MAVETSLDSGGLRNAIVIALLGILLASLIWSFFFSASLNKLPGPWYTRFTRIPLKLAIITGRRLYFTHQLHLKYGKLVRLSPDEISVVDEESVKRIYSFTNGYRKSNWYRDMNPFPDPNIFWTVDQQVHAKRRRLYSRPFSKAMLRSEWEQVARSNVELAVQKIIDDIEQNKKSNILKWFMFMTADIVTTVMFGESFHQIEAGKKSEFMVSIERVMQGAGFSYELPWLRMLAKWLPMSSLRELFNSNQILERYGSIAVTNARKGAGMKTFFSEILAKEGQRSLNDLEIICEACGELLAGSDTTSISLTYLVWAVLSHPQVRKDLEQQLADLPDNFDDTRLEALPLLGAVIDETLRLYGPVSGALPRAVPQEGAMMGGFKIPPTTTVSSQAFTVHRDPDIFEDPERFDPYRWTNGLDKKKVSFLPWGAGARMCPGQNLAYMELRYATAILFRRTRGRLQLAKSVTPESMEIESFFLSAPKSHQCEVEFTQ